jgi:phytanoyl-CoA hydroxylase
VVISTPLRPHCDLIVTPFEPNFRYIKGSHKGELKKHRTASAGSHILMTEEASEEDPGATPVPLSPGSAVLWHGRTAHYSRGNVTDQVRRTFITNFRPESMVQWERENGFDHLRKGFGDYAKQKETGGDVYD